MDTEQYEEAVRDYEKVYQTEKTKGEAGSYPCPVPLLCQVAAGNTGVLGGLDPGGGVTVPHTPCPPRAQAAAEECAAGAEEEQAERLLQDPGRGQERLGG